MIKSNELRIGNYIMFGAMRHSTSRWDIFNLAKAENKGLSLESYQPIPLTKDWLVKLGFSEKKRDDFFSTWHIGINPVTHDYLFDLSWASTHDVPFYRNGHFKIQYVHQLQNLYFALTGDELTIIN